MKVSNERLAEMLAGLDGVTKGPWAYRPQEYDDWGFVRAPSPDSLPGDLVCVAKYSIDLDEADLDNHRRMKTDPVRPLGEHISRCDPDTMRAILTDLLSLRNAQSEAVAWTTPRMIQAMQEDDTICGTIWPAEREDVTIPLYTHPAPQSEAVAVKSSCPTCNGTGDHCGNPDFGQCDDCGGTGWLHTLTHPAPPLAVTDEARLNALPDVDDLAQIIRGVDHPRMGAGLLAEAILSALTAALEAKQ